MKIFISESNTALFLVYIASSTLEHDGGSENLPVRNHEAQSRVCPTFENSPSLPSIR